LRRSTISSLDVVVRSGPDRESLNARFPMLDDSDAIVAA
jgi:hypothetical protein